MSKLNKKLPILFASLAMAMGVGLVGSKDAKDVNAASSAIYTSGTPNFGSGYAASTQDLSGVSWYFPTAGNYTSVGWNSTGQNHTKDSGVDLGPLSQVTESTKYGFYQTSSDFNNAQKFEVEIANYDTVKGNYYIFYSVDSGSNWSLATTGALPDDNSNTTLSYDHGEAIGSKVYFALGFGTSVTTKTRITLNGITVYDGKSGQVNPDPNKTVASVTGVESHPSEIFVGETIDGADVELNVLYDDGETGVELAHHVDVDSSVATNGVTATAYYDEEGTMSATFTVDVLEEMPNTVALFESSKVVTASGYKEYKTDDWILTFGGNNVSGGTNSGNASSCKVDSKYIGNAGVSSSVSSFAIVSAKKLDNVGKVVFTYSAGSNNSNGKMYLTSSVDGSNYSIVTLTSGNQGMSVGSTNTDYIFEFEKIESAYYAIIIASTSSTGNFRFDNIVAEFIAAPEKVNLVEQFINDWKEMRANGTKGICDYDLNGTNALTDLLNRFEEFGEEDKALIRSSIDVDDVTIGDTMDYINNVLRLKGASEDDNTGISLITSLSENKTTSLVALFAILGLVAVSAYYFIEKKKLAK